MYKQRKRMIVIFSVILIIAIFILCIYSSKEGQNNNDDLEMELLYYTHATINFTPVTTEEVISMLDKDQDFFLYVGRATCPYCRKVAPILSKVVTNKGVEMFYLDSEDTDYNDLLKSFRKEHGITTVPSILHSEKGGGLKIIEVDYDNNAAQIEAQLYEIL